MKHYLNTELRGKTDANGNVYYPVYIKFSVNSQTYKYRSQLVRRPLSLEEYHRLEKMYNGKRDSTLLKKERDIVDDIIDKSIVNGKFVQSLFKKELIPNCTSILDILNEFEFSLPITKWDKKSLNAELFSNPELELIDQKLNIQNGVDRFTHYQLNAIALKYHSIRSNSDDNNGLMLVYDWLDGDCDLQKDFFAFLDDNESNKSLRNEMIEHLNSIINEFLNKFLNN